MAASRRGRGGGLAALLAVLMLLAVPALAGRAHASMPSTDMRAMGTGHADTPMISRSEVAPPVRHGAGEAVCTLACSLAGQLLPTPFQVAIPQRRADAAARYFADARRLAGVIEEPGSPPPR